MSFWQQNRPTNDLETCTYRVLRARLPKARIERASWEIVDPSGRRAMPDFLVTAHYCVLLETTGLSFFSNIESTNKPKQHEVFEWYTQLHPYYRSIILWAECYASASNLISAVHIIRLLAEGIIDGSNAESKIEDLCCETSPLRSVSHINWDKLAMNAS